MITIYCYSPRQQQLLYFLGLAGILIYVILHEGIMLSSSFHIIYHFALKAPNANKPFGSKGILCVLELLVMKL